MSRKDDLAPAEIWEAQYRAEEACAAISCETDYDMPCSTRRCDPASCMVIQFEAARLMEEETVMIAPLPKLHTPWRSVLVRERVTGEQANGAMLMGQECTLHYSRAGLFHLGNGCYRALPKI